MASNAPSADALARQPRVAVLMAIVDRDPPGYVGGSIESLLRQTYRPIDVHLMVSGPLAAELRRLIDGYARRSPEVTIHSVDERRPLGVNLNDLISRTPGYELYARMDSDDESLPDRFEKQVAFLTRYPAIDIAGGAVVDIDERGRELKTVRYPLTHEDIVRSFRRRTPVAHPTVMMRRSFFEKAGPYPARPLEDGLYWMRAILSGCRFANLPDVLLRLRRSDDMLRRRSGLRTNWEELKIRWTIDRALGFGPLADAYGLAMFAVQMSPLWLKRRLYDWLR